MTSDDKSNVLVSKTWIEIEIEIDIVRLSVSLTPACSLDIYSMGCVRGRI